MRPRPSGNHEFLATSVKTEADAVVKPECENISDESRLVVYSDCSEVDDEETELEDAEVEAGHKRFSVAEMNPNPRPSGNYDFLENPVKTKTDAVVMESDQA